MFAAVGTDGTRPVVWGLGATADDALAEAREGLSSSECDSELDCYEITDAQAERVRAGDVSWPVLTY